MAFSRGFLTKRVGVLVRSTATDTAFGKTGGAYILHSTFWANITYNKGVKALCEGALDARETYMVRCDYHAVLTRECRLQFYGKDWQITSNNYDREKNEMQIICVELTKQS